MDAADLEERSDKEMQTLYYLLGSLIHNLKIDCPNCISAITSSEETIEPSLLTHYKEYKENRLVYPKMEVFSYFVLAEQYFKKIKLDLMTNKINFDVAAEGFLTKHKLNLTMCHSNNVNALVRLFFRTRFFFALKMINKNENHNSVDKSSRSIAMRNLVKNVK